MCFIQVIQRLALKKIQSYQFIYHTSVFVQNTTYAAKAYKFSKNARKDYISTQLLMIVIYQKMLDVKLLQQLLSQNPLRFFLQTVAQWEVQKKQFTYPMKPTVPYSTRVSMVEKFCKSALQDYISILKSKFVTGRGT